MKTTIKNFQIIVVLLSNTFAFAVLFFYSGIALAEEQKTQQENEVAFVMHPYDRGSKYENINSYRHQHEIMPKNMLPKIVVDRILGGNKHIPNDADISFTQWGAEGQELWFLYDGSSPEISEGIPVTWNEFYKTKNYKLKRLKYTQMQTNSIVQKISFANWDLEGSEFEVRGDLTDAIVTNCTLIAPLVNEKYDEQLAQQAYKIFTTTWNYKNNVFNGITLVGFDLRSASFGGYYGQGKDISRIVFIDCKMSDNTHANEYLFRNSQISNYKGMSEWSSNATKEQLYKTRNYDNKRLGKIKIPRMPGLDLTKHDLTWTTISGSIDENKFEGKENYNLEGYKFDDAYLNKTNISGMNKEQLYVTKSYKEGNLNRVYFSSCNFANANFTKVNLTGCGFANTIINTANFTDAIISNCGFRGSYSGVDDKMEITIEQIKSTWNYKNNRMDGITFSAKMQKALDAEKQTTTNETSK
jgi:uncharacterized protein YjbI with pentapeptide repeats